MADDVDVASTLKSGFVVLGLLLAGILFVLVNQSDGASEDRGMGDTQIDSPDGGDAWSKALEKRCRNLKGRLDAMDDRHAQLEREYNQGRYTEAEAAALQNRLVDTEARLMDQLYGTCAPNQALWDYLGSTW
jgi:hypothetical protein